MTKKKTNGARKGETAPKKTKTAPKTKQTGARKQAPARSLAKTQTNAVAKIGGIKGIKEISFTPNKISLTQKTSNNVNGKYSSKETRTYVDNTEANRAAVQNAVKGRKICKITYKFS